MSIDGGDGSGDILNIDDGDDTLFDRIVSRVERELIAQMLADCNGVQLKAAGLRADLDDRQEKIGYKIREAQLQKVPYMLVVGDREVAEHQVSVRSRSGGDQGARGVGAFIEAALIEVADKAAPSTAGAEG